MSKRASVGLLLAGLVGAVAVACGGGGGGDGAGNGQGVTDPAKVPSSTPISRGQPQVYQINQDGSLSISGGAPVTGTPLTGGGSTGTGGTYTVQPGDTCGGIASSKGVTVAELIAANRAAINSDCTNLRVGDELKIPGTSGGATPTRSTGGAATATPRAGSRTYTVASGDTCGAIAANQGVKVEDLIALNGLDSNCTSLQVGQVLKIPG